MSEVRLRDDCGEGCGGYQGDGGGVRGDRGGVG